MTFDIRTLLVAVTLATAFSAAARVLLWWMHRGIPGLANWAWAGIISVPALYLMAFRDLLPHEIALSLAQVFVAVGLGLAWQGFRQFVGRPRLTAQHWTGLLLIVMIGLAAGYNTDSLSVRASFNTGLVAVLSALIARELFLAAGREGTAVRLTAWVYALNAAFFAVRSATVAIQGDAGIVTATLNPDGRAALALFWWLGMTLAITLGMILMTSQRLKRELDHQVSHDPLTGALNRRAFSLIAGKELARAQRTGQPLSMIMLDLDNFKQVNDQLGHGVGDQVLCRFTAVANELLRGEDVFCRFGGEEFVVLLPGATADQALAVAERLRRVYAEEASGIDGGKSLSFPLTVSAGVSQWRHDEAVDSLLQRVDLGLYRAKRLGRNRSLLVEETLEKGAVLADLI